jgi:DNA adenine methylase
VRHDVQDSFIFLDPPYRYTGKIKNDKGCVTVYNGEIFTDEQHLKLNKYLRGIKQAKWLMTINDDEWIRELYDGYEIVSNSVFYSCSNTKAGRGHRKELLIANYPITEKANQLKYLLEEPLDRTRTSKDNKGMDSN